MLCNYDVRRAARRCCCACQGTAFPAHCSFLIFSFSLLTPCRSGTVRQQEKQVASNTVEEPRQQCCQRVYSVNLGRYCV
jgi:hypothetical protein